MTKKQDIRLVAFDADDTLWDNQTYFDRTEAEYARLLADYGSREEVSAALFKTETANMPLLGYGSKAFTISLVENAIAFSGGRIGADTIADIVELGKNLLHLPADPLPEVEPTLRRIRKEGRLAMAVFTKGEILDQQNKLHRSGLESYFDDVIVVADKTREEYVRLCRREEVAIGEMLMVGNSFRSDIEPVLQLGGWAAHIPFHTLWKHEQTQEYDHDHLVRLTHFGQLTEVLGLSPTPSDAPDVGKR